MTGFHIKIICRIIDHLENKNDIIMRLGIFPVC